MGAPRKKPGWGKGVLAREIGLTKFGGARYHPTAALEPFVEHFWTTHWDLRGEPRFVQDVLPHPAVHVVLERGCSEVVGPMTGKFSRVLEGQGRVFSAMFAPGGFHAFYGKPISSLVDQRVPMAEIFDTDVAALEARVFETDDERVMVRELGAVLEQAKPRRDRVGDQVRALAQRIHNDPELTKVGVLAAETGQSTRTLQRLFARYVGLSPKWLIQRRRLHEAAERLAEVPVPSFTGLASELGYADQAHFIRDFQALVGRTPAEYARQVQMLAPS